MCCWSGWACGGAQGEGWKGDEGGREVSQNILHFPNPFLPLFPPRSPRRAENLPVAKESCLAELQKGRFYFHGVDKKGRPVAYYSLACHDPKHRDIAEIMRMMTYQVGLVLSSLPLSLSPCFPSLIVFSLDLQGKRKCTTQIFLPPTLPDSLPPALPPSSYDRWRRPCRRCRRA